MFLLFINSCLLTYLKTECVSLNSSMLLMNVKKGSDTLLNATCGPVCVCLIFLNSATFPLVSVVKDFDTLLKRLEEYIYIFL